MLSDIEIAQSCTLKPIEQIARKAGIAPDLLEPYGRHKAKVDYIALQDKPLRGKLVLVTAINPTPAGEGKTTTTVGLGQAMKKIGKTPSSPCASHLWARCSASRAARRAADMPRWCPWRTSTCTSRAICTPSPRPTT